MSLLDLPNEILLQVFKDGGPDMLVGGASQSCKLLRDISNDRRLWSETLDTKLKRQYLSPSQMEDIEDYREWYLKQRLATKRTTESLDLLVNELRDSSAQDLEIYSWQILKQRLRATEGLEMAEKAPKSLAHLHWAHWLKEIMYRLEGLHLLLELSTKDRWGNGIIENPIEQVIALYTLRMGRYPVELYDTVNKSIAEQRLLAPLLRAKQGPQVATAARDSESDCASGANDANDDATSDADLEVQLSFGRKDLVRAAELIVEHVFDVFRTVSQRNDFLTVLGRGSVFLTLWSKLGLHSRLLKLPFGSYVCVFPPTGAGGFTESPAEADFSNTSPSAPFFIDFQRQGKIRSMEEVRDRLHVMGITKNLQYGVSLYDTLSTSYVWHTAPTETRHCVLDLIEHAAYEVKVTLLSAAPNLYRNLVHRIIKRNISQIENAPLSRAVSSASLVSMAGASSGGWLRRGKVVRVLAADTSAGGGPTAQGVLRPYRLRSNFALGNTNLGAIPETPSVSSLSLGPTETTDQASAADHQNAATQNAATQNPSEPSPAGTHPTPNRAGRLPFDLGATPAPVEASSDDSDEVAGAAQATRFGVVLELDEGSVLVQMAAGTERVIHAMLMPAYNLPLKSVAGLEVPDVGIDALTLGQHFMNYNIVAERFE